MFKIPCGGFELDEKSFAVNGTTLSTLPINWNDLTDKPFGENEDGTITTIDSKYLPEDIGGASSWNDLTDKPEECIGLVRKNVDVNIKHRITTFTKIWSITESSIPVPNNGQTFDIRFTASGYLKSSNREYHAAESTTVSVTAYTGRYGDIVVDCDIPVLLDQDGNTGWLSISSINFGVNGINVNLTGTSSTGSGVSGGVDAIITLVGLGSDSAYDKMTIWSASDNSKKRFDVNVDDEGVMTVVDEVGNSTFIGGGPEKMVSAANYFGGINGSMTFSWDGEVGERDNFQVGTFTYCKMSSAVFNVEEVLSGSVTMSSGSVDTNGIREGTGCFVLGGGAGMVMFVPKAGNVSGPTGLTGTAPSAGIYFARTTMWYISEATINCVVPNSVMYLNSTSGNRFAITVSDDGVLTATKAT